MLNTFFPTSHFQPEVNETYGTVFVFIGGYLTVTAVVLLNQKKNQTNLYTYDFDGPIAYKSTLTPQLR